ncbi:MAG: YkgJ family cysteine cluster protein [Candidatus Gastranaerophilales bacterium]|nr:YkgJ family cysteine cluster protein [Candidatus Gastranaerophilales bacterium]
MILKKLFYKYILRKNYYRYGSCKRCGDCCSKIYVCHQKSMINDIKEFEKLKKLHPFYTYLEVIDKDSNGLVFKCRNFDKENHICKIHKLRPGICRRYPDEIILKMKGVMSENCGFYFKPIDTFEEILNKTKKKLI